MADRRTLTNPVVHGLRIHVPGVSPLPPLAAARYHADASRFLIFAMDGCDAPSVAALLNIYTRLPDALSIDISDRRRSRGAHA